jgi:hypothetical protein|tara:strand:+ start:5483 stop:5593 length:111 start_codon:yes stop_codon:yes gene_type:complete
MMIAMMFVAKPLWKAAVSSHLLGSPQANAALLFVPS